MENGFTESETPFLADFTSKNFFLLKSLEWLGFTKYHIKCNFFPVAERLLIQVITQRAYSEPRQTSKMELFAEIDTESRFTKSSILDVYQGSEYVCHKIRENINNSIREDLIINLMFSCGLVLRSLVKQNPVSCVEGIGAKYWSINDEHIC